MIFEESKYDQMSFMTKYRREILLIIGCLIGFFILSSKSNAQNRHAYIYGRVTTYSNQYEGQIRWGNEEAIWLDHFNAEKVHPTVEVEGYRNSDWSIVSIWKENKASTTHQFSCQFGDIKEISGIGRSRFTLIFKDGTDITLNGSGYNDVGATLRVEDEELGLVKIKWDKIRKVEFFEAKDGSLMLGEHLYGTVKTFRNRSFEGYIIWDADERLGNEKLDGKANGEKVSISFKNIRSIEREGNGCDVTLKSGRSMYVSGTNDVNEGNRGIVVMSLEIGYIEIPWSDFEQAEFHEPKRKLSYRDFTKPKGIYGQIYTRGERSYSGRLVYDLDEFWEFEMIEGKDGRLEYSLPIRNIQRIEPKNDSYTEIRLKNGEILLLGKLRDVTRSNAGVLVISGNNKKTNYIDWDDILEIVFD